jgi:hypothetical protein
VLERLKLTIHPEKTRIVELGIHKEGFDFLGCHFQRMRSHFKRRTYCTGPPGLTPGPNG